MKKGLSKGVTGLLAASLVLSGVSYANKTASAASIFSDVKPGWAEKHITKLAMQGILKGGTGKQAGMFSPANKVTRQEAVIIALRFMGVDNEVKTGEPLVFPSDLVIKDDYKPYIKLAVQKNILLLDEEIALVQKDGGKEWGSSPATREWMAKLLVRAIGKDQAAKEAGGQATAFSDDNQIDAGLKGYVSVATALGLVNGVTATKFDPTASVTREMASTLFSRAESQINVAYAGQVTGALVGVEGSKLTVLHSDGVVKSYTLSPTASVYGFGAEQTTDISSLMLYSEVILIGNSDGTVGFVEQTSETAKVKNIEGSLLLVSEAQNKLTVTIDGEPKTVSYDAQTLTIKDINGQSLTIADLPLNVPVTLGVDVATESKLLSLTVNKAVTNKSGSGTVEAVDVSGLTLQVKDAAGNSDSYPIDANAVVKHNGTNLSLDQLVPGDVVSYEVKMGSVTSVTVTNKVQPPIEGVINLVDKGTKTIQYRIGSELGVKEMIDNVAVKLEGLSNVTLDDLFKGDTVSMTLNESGKVSIITIKNRSVNFLNAAIVFSADLENDILIVTDSANKKVPLILTETTRFDLNGTVLTKKDAAKYIIKGKKINVGYTNSNAAYVSVVSQYTGTVLENNLSAKTLKLQLDNKNEVVLPYPNYFSAEIYGTSSTSYLDIRVGDKVTALMDYNTQDTVIAVQVQKTVQFELDKTDLSLNRIRAKRADGAFEEWSLNTTLLSLVDENDNPISLNALSQSGAKVLNVTFNGRTPIKIKVHSVTYGRVTSVNAAANSLELVTNAGTTVTKSFAAAPSVVRNNAVVGSLSSIKSDDRIEVRVDESDRPVIEIVQGISKKYLNHNSSTLFVARTSLNENNTYDLHPQVYVHQGTKTILLSEMKNGDALTLFIVRGKVVEIAK
ncbi:S-layer homology domain-containing protein [Cohnella cellulosilytica]|uniref:S-layer homology domain-containing protein n=1 Tax=Cohnella cellulosilytica TaxID=986710 RepID=A0ABW2F6Q0_9BACL